MQKWSVIIFCYNEENSVGNVVQKTLEVLKKLSPQGFEIVIVDDGSTDRSPEIIREKASGRPEIQLVFHDRNRGIGKALLSGYAAVRYENICAVPADMEFDVTELLHVPVPAPQTFISLYRKENISYTTFRNILSWINRQVNRFLLGVRLKDVNWVKVYKKSSLEKIGLKMKSSLVESEICAKLMITGHKALEIESAFTPRATGEDKGASFRIVWQAIRETLPLIFYVNLFRLKRSA